jgi:hypothetical protein
MPWVDKQRGDGKLTWEPVVLPQNLLDQLVHCLKVPEERKERAASILDNLFNLAHDWHQFDEDDEKRQEAQKQLARLAKKTAAYLKELDELGDLARVWLGLEMYRRDFGYFVRAKPCERRLQINDLALMADGVVQARARYKEVCSAVDTIHGASAADFWEDYRPRGAGRPPKLPGGPYETSFEYWVGSLCSEAAKEGWSLTVSPGNGTGTLLDFLNIAREHLPNGFVPQTLDEKGLQRLRQVYIGQGPQRI